MREVKFITDKESQTKRIYFERDVLDVERVRGIQQALQKKVPLTPTGPDDLHVTLLHVGKPQNLLKEIRVVNPDLSEEDFLDQFSGFLLSVSHVLRSDPIETRGQRFDIYGDQENPVLVIGLEKTREYKESRRPFVEGLQEILFRCGVQTPDQFMEDNPNLRYALDKNHNPHITLGKIPSAEIELPSFSQRLFRLSSPTLMNAIIS